MRGEPGAQGRALQERQERGRPEQAAGGVLPAGQRLHPDHVPVVDGNLRLVVQHDLVVLQRVAQRPEQLETRGGVAFLTRGAACVTELVLLGGVHRGVGVAQEGERNLTGLGGGNSDAHLDINPGLVQEERGGERLGDPLGGLLATGRRGTREENGELVPAEPADGVLGPHAGLQPLGDRHQQQVAVVVAKGVVDVLEAVQIEQEHRRLRLARPGGAQSQLTPNLEQRAVGQPGQRIVVGLVGQLGRHPPCPLVQLPVDHGPHAGHRKQPGVDPRPDPGVLPGGMVVVDRSAVQRAHYPVVKEHVTDRQPEGPPTLVESDDGDHHEEVEVRLDRPTGQVHQDTGDHHEAHCGRNTADPLA